MANRIGNGQIHFGPDPINTQCFHCNQTMTTSTQTAIGMKQWVAGAILCFFG